MKRTLLQIISILLILCLLAGCSDPNAEGKSALVVGDVVVGRDPISYEEEPEEEPEAEEEKEKPAEGKAPVKEETPAPLPEPSAPLETPAEKEPQEDTPAPPLPTPPSGENEELAGGIEVFVPEEPEEELDPNDPDQPDMTNIRKEADPNRPYYDLGINRQLKGKPIVYLFFVDDEESSWSAMDVTEFTKTQITPALNYLREKAGLFNVALDFQVRSFSTPLSMDYTLKYEGTVLNYTDDDEGQATEDVLDYVAQDMGYSSANHMYKSFKEKSEGEEVLLMTFFNKNGRSYTYLQSNPGYYNYTEHCVVFAEPYYDLPYLVPPSYQASVVAHEMLHLFGAEDYYNDPYRVLLTLQEFPNDIMLYQQMDINQNDIGGYTAYCIGWTSTRPPVCNYPGWLKK